MIYLIKRKRYKYSSILTANINKCSGLVLLSNTCNSDRVSHHNLTVIPNGIVLLMFNFTKNIRSLYTKILHVHM